MCLVPRDDTRLLLFSSFCTGSLKVSDIVRRALACPYLSQRLDALQRVKVKKLNKAFLESLGIPMSAMRCKSLPNLNAAEEKKP